METKGRTRWAWAALVAVVALALAAVVGLTACSSDSSSSSSDSSADSKYADLDSVTLIMADGAAKGAAANLWGEAVSEKVTEITGGKLTIDYHGTGELGGDADILRQVQSNDIQMIDLQPAVMASFVEELAVFDLPMAFATYDADQINTVLNGDGEFATALQAAYEEAGFHNLGWLQAGTYRQTTSNKDLSTLEGFQGFQIRTMENTNHMAFWSAIGAEPTPLAFSEVYFALQNGTVDGQENAVDTCVGSSFQEVQKYLAFTNHILYANTMCINKDCWDSLDPAYQEAIEQAVEETTEEIASQMVQMEEDNTKVFTDAGCEVITYDDSFFEQVLALDGVQKLYSDISEQTGGLSDKMLAELEATK